MKRAISSFIVLPLLLIGFGSLQGATLLDDAVAYWGFEGNLDGTHSINLADVSGTTTGMSPTIVPAFNPVSGIKAVNAGTQAVAFDGTNVLKSNSPSLRIGGAQTLWLRVNLGSIPAGTVAFMTRSRPVNSQRGISLQMTNGRLQGYLSADGTTYDTQLTSATSYALQASSWYDISMRFDPSNVLRIDLYDPMTGTLLDSMETTTNVPASISTSNSIGSGYFQVGSINNGGAGSSYLVPNGTLIESAAVWNSYLSDDQIRTLSAVPEPRSISMLMMGGASLAMILRLSRAR
ncbi:hypothetical protein DB345_13025 [Spartobacteria bacterium LR76]|nr:hypothetical protein DB345_13025 [Spartobacteria bacterium LR76]